MNLSQKYEHLLARLRRYRRYRKLLAFAEKAFLFIAAVCLSLLLLPALYAVGQNDPVFRWLVTLAAFAAFLYFGLKLFITPLMDLLVRRHAPSLDRVAFEVGLAFADVKDELSNAIQIISEIQGDPDRRMAPFAWRALERVEKKVAVLQFEQTLSSRKAKRWALLAIVSAVLIVLAVQFYPDHYASAFARLLNPAYTLPEDGVEMVVTPGDAEIIRGENLTIRAEVLRGSLRSPALIVVFNRGEYTETIPLEQTPDGTFSHTLSNILAPLRYRVAGEHFTSPLYDVSVIDLPDIRHLQLSLHPPRYTKLPTEQPEANVGSISVLPGTRVDFEIAANKPLARACVLFASGDSLDLKPDGGIYRASIRAMREDRYQFFLQDERGLQNKESIEYQIKLVPDQYPVVQFDAPGEDIDIDERMLVQLDLSGEDDFGFSKLVLHYKVFSAAIEVELPDSTQQIPYVKAGTHLQASYVWNLDSLNLLPEDVVEYRAILYDNDTVLGPKSATTKTYRLRFPSMQEIFTEATQEQEEAVDTFDEMLSDSKEIKEHIEQVLQNFRKQRELGWDEKQALKENIEKQKQMLENLEAVDEKLDEMIERMKKNELLSLETLQKYEELQELLEEIASPELQKMMQNLQKAIENLDPRQIQKALEEFQLSQEEYLKSLDRTINLLKQLQAEQKLEEAIRTAEEMLQRQEAINKQMQANPDSARTRDLARQEAQQMEALQRLQEALDDLAQRMQELPQMQLPQENIREAQKLARGDELSQEMQQTAEALQKQQMQEAMQSGQNVQQTLQRMQQMLSQAQQQMQQNQRNALMQALRKNSRNILTLSKKQEQLARSTSGQSRASSRYRDLAQEQQDLLNAMERVTEQIFQMSQQSFFVPPELGRKLAEATQKMQTAVNELAERRGHNASKSQGQAMQSLNGAAMELREAMKSLSNAGGGGSGLEEFMQRMLGLSGQQQGLNQQTRPFGQGGQMSLEQQAALSRLAARQEALRKSIQELQRDFGNRREVLGSLDKIAEEMKKVVEDMRRRNVSRSTIERQERILSRLLDAQKSVQKRDYSKKRKAETGKRYMALDPGNLPPTFEERQKKLQQDLLRAMQENYSRDYKLLIQKYFEALSRELQKNGNGNE